MYQYKFVRYIMTNTLHTFVYIMYFYVDNVTDYISVKIHGRWRDANEL